MFTLGLIILLALLIALTALAETDNGGIGFWVMVTVFAIFEFWLYKGCMDPIGMYIVYNPGIVVFGVVAYIILGVLWSFCKWYMYLKDYKREFDTYHAKWKTDNPTPESSRINPKENKSRLISWMAYWPLSACWFIMHKPFTRLYNWIFEKVSKTYQQIADKVFKVQ